MMFLTDFSVSLELSTLIIAAVIGLGLLIMLIVNCCRKDKLDIDGVDVGLDGLTFHICSDKEVRQIAYKLWVEINTRVIGVKINLDHDIIRAVHESYYTFFKSARLLIEDIPANSINKSKQLINLSISFLNEVMRPYLTKWGIKFNDWYDKEREIDKNTPPQKLQRHYDEFKELSDDLLQLNLNIINYSNSLKRIAFKTKE